MLYLALDPGFHDDDDRNNSYDKNDIVKTNI